MDNGNGILEKITEEKFEQQINKAKPMVFKVGEILEIRGSRFRTEKVLRNKIVLKLLPTLSS